MDLIIVERCHASGKSCSDIFKYWVSKMMVSYSFFFFFFKFLWFTVISAVPVGNGNIHRIHHFTIISHWLEIQNHKHWLALDHNRHRTIQTISRAILVVKERVRREKRKESRFANNICEKRETLITTTQEFQYPNRFPSFVHHHKHINISIPVIIYILLFSFCFSAHCHWIDFCCPIVEKEKVIGQIVEMKLKTKNTHTKTLENEPRKFKRTNIDETIKLELK